MRITFSEMVSFQQRVQDACGTPRLPADIGKQGLDSQVQVLGILVQ